MPTQRHRADSVHFGQHDLLALGAGEGKEHQGIIVYCSILSSKVLGNTMITLLYYLEHRYEDLLSEIAERLEQTA
jgi:hypothetical protein